MLVGGITSEFALLCYRLGYDGLPLGRAAAVVEVVSGTLPVVFLPLAVLLFRDGKLPPRRWRWVVGTFMVIAALVLAGEFAQAVGAVIGHPVRVDSGGGLLALDHRPRALWESAAARLGVAAYPLVWLLAIGRQVAAWRGADGVRRQHLKWLMSGPAWRVPGWRASSSRTRCSTSEAAKAMW